MAAPHNDPSGATSHRERLYVPLSWWLLALGFGLTLVIAVGAYTNIWFAAATALVVLAVVGGCIWAYGHAVVAADAHGFTAGDSHVEWQWVADVEPLDEAGVAAALGPGGSAAGHLLTRPYAKGAVRVVLDDPADPHPFWLVSSRHADELAGAARSWLPATVAR